MADMSDLIGSWRMDAWTRTSVDTGETTDALGPAPIGYIAYHPDGRMMATVFRRDRPAPSVAGWTDAEKARLFDDMLAYVASYTLEDDRVIHHVDGSWNPNWHGDLSRPFTLDGDRLVISGAPGIDPATGERVVYRMEFTKV
ncbi:lipocalin-like domain-containing protein [Maribius pontilimi]|uniref:Lipocalin-like domain-containing protein n=1 Tax=Palleronia pontilimi TaxID=1964209 RepID=A0A934I8S2_9RHOB|nr:lipocalin-like domain-containing protein [Palleronia pontilimi]MBJ3761166.1 lipocalin-like domain-containing protein [Palleronia pontilimi]